MVWVGSQPRNDVPSSYGRTSAVALSASMRFCVLGRQQITGPDEPGPQIQFQFGLWETARAQSCCAANLLACCRWWNVLALRRADLSAVTRPMAFGPPWCGESGFNRWPRFVIGARSSTRPSLAKLVSGGPCLRFPDEPQRVPPSDFSIRHPCGGAAAPALPQHDPPKPRCALPPDPGGPVSLRAVIDRPTPVHHLVLSYSVIRILALFDTRRCDQLPSVH